MAIFHASLRVLTRTKGESAVAASAYRAGTSLLDERQGKRQDYTRRKGVDHGQILLPPGSPAWAKDVGKLWNAVEAAELRGNSRVARELIIGLPHELSPQTRRDLACSVAQELVNRYSVAVQVAVHAPDRGGDDRNWHAHLLFTPRALGEGGFGAKVRVLDEPKSGPGEIAWIRQRVAELTNTALAGAGSAERVDHRSLVVQARAAQEKGDFVRAALLTRAPTIHLGSAQSAALRRGERPGRAVRNAQIVESNRGTLAAYLEKAQAEGRLMPAAADARPARVQTRTTPTTLAALAAYLLRSRSKRTPRAVLTRTTRSTGRDAALLNSQARLLDQATAADAQRHREFLESLRSLRLLWEVPMFPVGQTLYPMPVPFVRIPLPKKVERRATRRPPVFLHLPLAPSHGGAKLARTEAPSPPYSVRKPGTRLSAQERWEAKRRARIAKVREAMRIEVSVDEETADGDALLERARRLRKEAARLETELREEATRIKRAMLGNPRLAPLSGGTIAPDRRPARPH